MENVLVLCRETTAEYFGVKRGKSKQFNSTICGVYKDYESAFEQMNKEFKEKQIYCYECKYPALAVDYLNNSRTIKYDDDDLFEFVEITWRIEFQEIK